MPPPSARQQVAERRINAPSGPGIIKHQDLGAGRAFRAWHVLPVPVAGEQLAAMGNQGADLGPAHKAASRILRAGDVRRRERRNRLLCQRRACGQGERDRQEGPVPPAPSRRHGGRNRIGAGRVAHDASTGWVGCSMNAATIPAAHGLDERTLWPAWANSIHWT